MTLVISKLIAGYKNFKLKGISLEIETESFVALIGPNGCGKSTLLSSVGRLIEMQSGQIKINDKDISRLKIKDLARLVTILPQSPVVPTAITLEQLVHYGRAPHQNLLGVKSKADRVAVEAALEITDIIQFRDRFLSDLSGGQRQRAFVAMCLAQDTPYILFDEPTSFLDLKYQYEIMDLIKSLTERGKTCLVVLHDIAQAARYADHLIVMRDGFVAHQGSPKSTITSQMLQQIYDIQATVYADPMTGTPNVSVIPRRPKSN